MKTLFLLLMTLSLAGTALGQKDPVSATFDKYSGKDGYTIVNITGEMLRMMAQIEEDRRDTTFLSKLNELKILVREKCSDQPVVNFRSEIYDKLDKSAYKEMMTVKEDDEDVAILVKESGGRISEFLIIVGGNKDNVLIQGKGNLLLNEIAKMTGGCHMKGLEHLKELEK
jgi:hypothetical protein